jgi:hypothetical protein
MARMWGRSCRPEEPSHDDSSDHNRDDSCTPNYGSSSIKTLQSLLLRHSAWFWQCGVRVRIRFGSTKPQVFRCCLTFGGSGTSTG